VPFQAPGPSGSGQDAGAAGSDRGTGAPDATRPVRQDGSGVGRTRRHVRLALACSLAVGYIAFLRPAEGLENTAARQRAGPLARPAPEAFGRSGHVRMRFALPGTLLDYPLEVATRVDSVRYDWIPLNADSALDQPRALANGLVAPDHPGFYRLELRTSAIRRIVDSVSLSVLVPFSKKNGASLNGYRIGYYRGERSRRPTPDMPAGFVQIDTCDLDLQVSDHLRLADFVSRDAQSTWPRYAAVDPRILDKVELVLDEIESWYGGARRASVAFDVHSGFRTPLHNRQVARAARDSRHQFGDALDLAVDANRDGRVSAADTKLVALAVEIVERAHPDLVGGMGIYTHSGPAYVHIDTRGQRVRWRG
jgi:uncharacterized protein YcbK (DUF882 family)